MKMNDLAVSCGHWFEKRNPKNASLGCAVPSSSVRSLIELVLQRADDMKDRCEIGLTRGGLRKRFRNID